MGQLRYRKTRTKITAISTARFLTLPDRASAVPGPSSKRSRAAAETQLRLTPKHHGRPNTRSIHRRLGIETQVGAGALCGRATGHAGRLREHTFRWKRTGRHA